MLNNFQQSCFVFYSLYRLDMESKLRKNIVVDTFQRKHWSFKLVRSFNHDETYFIQTSNSA
jgi:hypothetical protein